MPQQLDVNIIHNAKSTSANAEMVAIDFLTQSVYPLKLVTKELKHIKITFNDECILLYLNKRGKTNLKYATQAVKFEKEEQNMFHLASNELIVTANKNSEATLYFLRKKAFKNYILANGDESKTLEGQHFKMHLLLEQKTANIITEIEQCAFEAHLKGLYTKAKLIEIITYQLAQSNNMENPVTLSDIEMDRMRLVREIIDNNLTANFTISNLAREVGTNEQYLKKHFKIVFNKTIFGYITDLRMTYAKQLLASGKFKVLDVANQVGYMHATHFTKAFKKHFGLLPQKIKNNSFFISLPIFNAKFHFLETLFAYGII